MYKLTFEICRKSITLSRHEETPCQWCNSHYAVRTEKGIHMYEFAHNLESLDKRLDCVESFVSTPTSVPCSSIFDCKLVRSGLKNRDISEMMLDTAMWGHSVHHMQELSYIVMFKFSPPGLIRLKTPALAVLNNIGNVVIYTRGRHDWVSLLDLSSFMKDQFEEVLKKDPETFSDLRKVAHDLSTSSICWAPEVKNDYSYFVTCQKSGLILLWLVQSQGESVAVKFCGKIELAFGEIVYVKWIPKTENKFILLCSNLIGQLIALECQINKKHVILLKTHLLWEHQDKMIVKFCQYHIEGNRIILFYNKQRHLVGQLIDENCKILSQSIDMINDYRLTSLTKNHDQFYVSTINFRLYRIDYCIQNDVLLLTLDLTDIKDISPSMELYSVRFSSNGVMCALSAIDRRVLHKKDPLKLETIFIQSVSDNTILDILINNPTKQLTNYWDCIELLRYKMVKLKMLPAINFKELLTEGETDSYKLKIYLIILRIYRSLVDNIKISDGCLPEDSIELIKDKIVLNHTKSHIKKMYDKSVSGKLSDFEQEWFAGLKNYLLFYSKKHEICLNELVNTDMLNLIVQDYKYTCQCCDEQIKDFSCKDGHRNIFCSLTFTPIESLEYIACKYCNTLARLETHADKPLCVFCDSYLEKYHISL